MTIKCFACGAEIEGASVDAIGDAFVAHVKERHKAAYPENAVRNYARNYVEAEERMAGASTERLDEIGDVAVHPVTADRIDDWLHFFDHEGFAGNPDWASCYCLTHHVPPPAEEPERPWRTSRAMMVDRLKDGATYGYLAYVDGKAAGWVNASKRPEYPDFAKVDPNGPAPASVIGVSCFVIAPPYRRHRVASALLDRVIADAPSRGAAWVEGYPNDKPDDNDGGHFRGPRSMYEARGFQPIEPINRKTVMRRAAG